jgi:hypothetical protein
MALMLPVMAVVASFSQLNSERNEMRLRLFASLPLTSFQIGTARLLRLLVLPLLALSTGVLLILAATFVSGLALLARFEGAWLLLTLFLLSLCLSVIIVLLYDLGGTVFAQVATVGLTVVAFVLNAYSPAFVSVVIEPLSAAAQTPTGAALTCLLLALLTAVDLVLFGWRLGSRAA